MILCRVIGDVYATVKNPNFEGTKILIVQPLDANLKTKGSSLLALDSVDAGPEDIVLVNKEGGGARIIFQNDEIPVQAVIVAVVDDLEVEE
ncbi:MAG: EutN/CcmL family microcompartment protein [bacterium]|nr:EutN/CcmL family microcompartment protein [bacterium]